MKFEDQYEARYLYSNPENGAIHRGFILHLDNFLGDITFNNSKIVDVRTVASSCTGNCFDFFVKPTKMLEEIYGPEYDNYIHTYIIYVTNNDYNVYVNSDFNDVLTTASTVYIEKGIHDIDKDVTLYK
jgi:hypothetical protein